MRSVADDLCLLSTAQCQGTWAVGQVGLQKGRRGAEPLGTGESAGARSQRKTQ